MAERGWEPGSWLQGQGGPCRVGSALYSLWSPFPELLALAEIGTLIALSLHFTDDETEAKGHGGGGNEQSGLARSHRELMAW